MHPAAPPFPRILAVLVALALLLGLVSGCHKKAGPKIKVVTSIFPVYDLARRVAGTDADVVMLEPVEQSPHQYTPAPADIDRAAGTHVAIMVGLDFDSWMEPMMTRASPTARILRLADRVPTLPRMPPLTEEGQQAKRDASRRGADEDPRTPNGVDPHVWLDPQRAVLMVRAIGEELCRADPGNARGYRARSKEVAESIDALDKEIEAKTATWKQRTFVTLHDAFRYYAARYHLEVAASAEASPGVRPAIRYDQLVLHRLRERHAGGIFGEPQLDSQPARTLAHASGVPYGVLDPLGGTGTATSYEGLLRFDTDALEKVLAGEPQAVPPTAASASAESPDVRAP